MPLTINTNVSALTAQRFLGISSSSSASSLSKLSSGSRVPTAKEDAASLSIGTGLKADVEALRAAQVNAQQGASLLQIADGAFSQISDILVRMKSLATTAQSEQLSATERGFLDSEFTDLRDEIDRIAANTDFNGIKLLGGSDTLILNNQGTAIAASVGFVGFQFNESLVASTDTFSIVFDNATNNLTVLNTNTNQAQTLTVAAPAAGEISNFEFDDIGVTVSLNDDFDTTAGINTSFNTTSATFQFDVQTTTLAAQQTLDFQVGIGTTANDRITVTIDLGDISSLIGGGTIQDLTTTTNAGTASGQIDTAISSVSSARANLGTSLNRLDFASANLAVSIENSESARSTLMDVDVSAEITKFTSQQVLIQAGVSMLAQANQQPSLLLSLLQ